MESIESKPVRLNKYLSLSQGLSRREADNLIAVGRIRVNGSVAILGQRITPGVENINVDNKQLDTATKTKFVYLLFNKPVGYVCSRRQQGSAPTIYSLLPPQYHPLKPVGRLDKDSSGLLLLTNDGDFAHQMIHPKFYKVKKYQVTLDKPLAPLHRQMINNLGVQLPDGLSKFQISSIDDKDNTYEVTMSEGRNRQIRRTFKALNYKVIKLHRTSFGNYLLSALGDKSYKETTSDDQA